MLLLLYHHRTLWWRSGNRTRCFEAVRRLDSVLDSDLSKLLKLVLPLLYNPMAS